MTPEIRSKDTSIKLLPEGWELVKLSDLLEFKNGINADKEKFGHGTKLISVSDILQNSPILYDSIRGSVEVTDAQMKEFGVTYGDILFQRSSENYEDAGTSNVYLDKEHTAVFSGFVIRGKKISEYNPVYLNALLHTGIVRKEIIRRAAGAQHVNIGQDALSEIVIPFAPPKEQDRISEVLSTQDKAIGLIERQIKQKSNQKKYLVQILLTGRKRLAGFDSEWKKVRLNEVLTERKERNANQDLRICSVAVEKGVVDQIEHLGRSYAASDTSNYGVAHFGDVIYTKSPTGNFPYGIIKQNHMEERVAVSPLYGIYEPITYALGFILHTYFMYAVNAQNYLFPIVQKGAKNTINITNETFISNYLYLPLNAKEQEALMNVFKTIDYALELLQKELEQEKQKKKALMQLLLTGIVRV